MYKILMNWLFIWHYMLQFLCNITIALCDELINQSKQCWMKRSDIMKWVIKRQFQQIEPIVKNKLSWSAVIIYGIGSIWKKSWNVSQGWNIEDDIHFHSVELRRINNSIRIYLKYFWIEVSLVVCHKSQSLTYTNWFSRLLFLLGSLRGRPRKSFTTVTLASQKYESVMIHIKWFVY